MLVLVGSGLLPGVWKAGAAPVAARQAFEAELQACVGRVSTGYVTSGIHISPDDARTIEDACQRAVRERQPSRL